MNRSDQRIANVFITGAAASAISSRAEREAVRFELDALEEQRVGVVGVLLQIDDVAAVRRDERRHGGDDAALVGTCDEQNGVAIAPRYAGLTSGWNVLVAG